MGRRIAVIGAGADAVATVCQLISFRDTQDSVYQDDKITWIRDCSHKVENFGVSVNTLWITALATNTTISTIDYFKRFDAQQKIGLKFIGFGNRRDKNFHTLFDPTEISMHLDERKICDFYWENVENQHFNINRIDKRVNELFFTEDECIIDGESYDFVVDCVRGGLWDKETYSPAYFNPTDTKLTINRKIPGDWDYTAYIATEHGYLTGIPTQDAQTWVYSYDSDMTTEEEAVEDFNAHCAVKKHCSYKKLESDHKTSEYCIHENRLYARCGRALGLNDDLTGFNNYIETDIGEALGEFIFGDNDRPCNNLQRLEVEDRWRDAQIDQGSLMSFYMQFGTKYRQSDFWISTRDKACRLLEDKYLHSTERREVYEKLETIPDEENIRLDYFRHQAEADDKFFLRQRMTDESDEPYRMIGPYQSFCQAVYGLGAPYASQFPLMSPLWEPSEKGGEIVLDSLMDGHFKKRPKKK